MPCCLKVPLEPIAKKVAGAPFPAKFKTAILLGFFYEFCYFAILTSGLSPYIFTQLFSSRVHTFLRILLFLTSGLSPIASGPKFHAKWLHDRVRSSQMQPVCAKHDSLNPVKKKKSVQATASLGVENQGGSKQAKTHSYIFPR